MKFTNKNIGKNIIAWVVVILLTAVLYDSASNSNMRSSKITFSEFLHNVNGENVKEVSIRGNSIDGKLSDGRFFHTLSPPEYPQLVSDLNAHNVKIDVVPLESSMGLLFSILLSWFPVLLLIGVWIYFMRNMQGGSSKALDFGNSKARLVRDGKNRVLFKDVAGIDEAKEELYELVDFLKQPAKFQKLGGKIPRGCLLIGSPGTGKTLLAKAIAGEAGVPFFTISGSDFVEMFVGVGASRVRKMFKEAKQNAPCILFIDEIDAVGRHRGSGTGGGNDEREQTLNQLLVEMDGFNDNEGVIIVAATNRPDVLDNALLRPGRFDRQVTIPVPDINGREQILNVHVKKVPIAPDVDLRVVARGTPGFSGADLANVINEAALLAARKNMNLVTMREFESARDKVMMGAERKSMVMKDEEKRLTAYHEAGHALATIFSPSTHQIHKATIMPRGRALGLVMRLPEDDQYSQTKEKLLCDIVVSMGGRAAEEMIFGKDKITSGASSDIQQATNVARAMVTRWGLSDLVGPVLIGEEQDRVYGLPKQISDELASNVDKEIKRIISEGYEAARKILTEHLDKLHLIAEKLLEHETLTGQEIKDLVDGKTIRLDEDTKPDHKRKSSVPFNPESTPQGA